MLAGLGPALDRPWTRLRDGRSSPYRKKYVLLVSWRPGWISWRLGWIGAWVDGWMGGWMGGWVDTGKSHTLSLGGLGSSADLPPIVHPATRLPTSVMISLILSCSSGRN